MADQESQLPPLPKELPPRPPGVETQIYVIATSMTILPLIAIALRFSARYLKKQKLSWDDYMILPAMLGTVATAVCMYIGTSRGDLGRHTYVIEYQDTPFPIFTHATAVFLQIIYATGISTVLTFGFTKMAVLLFYKRIFQGALFNAACWTMIGVVFVWTIGFTFSYIFQCVPFSVNWNFAAYSPGNADAQCIDVNRMAMTQAWSDVATNVVIIFLPIGCIWKLQLPFWKKVGVFSTFFLGALTVGFGIAKLVVYTRVFRILNNDADPVLDFTFLQTPFVYWPMIESAVGIVGACLPLMRPLFSGASSHGVVRNMRSFNGTASDDSDTFWDHSDNSQLRNHWNNSLSSSGFSQASTRVGNSVSTMKPGSISQPKKPKGSMSTMNWGTNSLPSVDPKYNDANNIPPRKASSAVARQQISHIKLGVLNDDDLDDYPVPRRDPRRPHNVV